MIIFSDFDGTISSADMIDTILDDYYGIELRLNNEKEILQGKLENNYFHELVKNIPYDINKFLDILDNKLNKPIIDCYFEKFYNRCIEEGYEFFVISSGYKQFIHQFLPFIPKEKIYANDICNPNENFDKREILKEILSSRNDSTLYIGDGISDFSIIDMVDILYAKKHSKLEEFCLKQNVNCKLFNNFSELHNDLFHKYERYKLLSPGIVRKSDDVLYSLAHQHTFMHRNEEFHEIYKQVDKGIKGLLTESDEYITLLVTGSGTTSMDEVINAHINNNILILCNGMFGERWESIARFYNKENVYSIKNNWGEPFDILKINNFIKEYNIKTVIVVHCDTSVGILNDIESIGNNIKSINKDITYIVDAVSTFGAIPINLEKFGIDFLVTNPNKALASHMGLGIIVAKHSVIKKIKEEDCRSYSLNLARHYKCALNHETMNSVSISSINGLLTSIKKNFSNKIKINKDYEKYNELFNKMYDEVKYKKLLDKTISSPCIITIMIENSCDIIEYLKHNNFIVYECKGKLYNKGFQVSFYGEDGNTDNISKLIKLINSYK